MHIITTTAEILWKLLRHLTHKSLHPIVVPLWMFAHWCKEEIMSGSRDYTEVSVLLFAEHRRPEEPGVAGGAIGSQINSLTIVYSNDYSDADQRKHQSSASLAFVRGTRRGSVNSPHKWPVTRKMFPFDDVIMKSDYIPRPLKVWYNLC